MATVSEKDEQPLLPPECQVPEEYDHRCGWCRKMGVHPHSGCNHNHTEVDQLDWAEFRFGDVDWTETDWDCKPSQLAQEAANMIWEMALCDIYAGAPDDKVSMWCEWIQKAMYDKWLKNQEERMK